MKSELSQDAVTKAVHEALATYCVTNGIIHQFKALGEIIKKGERTAENRLTDGAWTVDELKDLITTFDNSRFKDAVKQYLQL